MYCTVYFLWVSITRPKLIYSHVLFSRLYRLVVRYVLKLQRLKISGASEPLLGHETQPAIPPVHEHFGSGHDLPHTQLDIHAPCDVLWTRPESGNTFFLNLAGILTVLGEGCKTRILRAIYVF